MPAFRILLCVHCWSTAWMHIGNDIRQVLRNQGRSVTWLARELHTVRENVYDIFRRESLDTDLLRRISIILGHNFFKSISRNIDHDLHQRL